MQPPPMPVMQPGAPLPPPAVRPTNALAVISLILGILSFIGIPLVGGAGAVICGHLAKKAIRESGEQGEGLATAGLVLGYIHLVLIGLFILVFVSIFVLGIGAAVLSH